MLNFRSFVLLMHAILWSFIGLPAAIVDPTGRLFSYLIRVGWASQFLWLAGMRVTIKGGDKIDRKKSYVVIANHQSQIDIPLLLACLPLPIRFLAKRSLFFIPLFGWALFFARFVPVNRSNSAKARRSIDSGVGRIKNGYCLAIFPEGTRSADGQIHRFKNGACVLAIKAEAPMLPVAIRGSYDVVPKTRLAVNPGPVDLIIGEPVSTAGLGLADKECLRQRMQEAVEAMFRTGVPAKATDTIA
jgi:1-acyl-sn-glycerol-3-phosphate acyltransferase